MTRRQLLTITVLGHAAIAVWCIVTLVHASVDPGHYHKFHNHPDSFVAPIDDIAWWSSAIGVELVVSSWVLRAVPSVPAASFALALIAAIATLVMAPLAIHAPPYFAMHVVFTALSTGWLALVAMVAKLGGPPRGLAAPADER